MAVFSRCFVLFLGFFFLKFFFSVNSLEKKIRTHQENKMEVVVVVIFELIRAGHELSVTTGSTAPSLQAP